MKSLHRLRPPRRGRARRGFGVVVLRSGRLRAGRLRGGATTRGPSTRPLRFPHSAAPPLHSRRALRVPLPTRACPCRRRAPSQKRCRAAFRPRALFVLDSLARVRLQRHFRPRRPSLFIITRASIIGGGGRAAHRSATTRRWYHVARAPRRR